MDRGSESMLRVAMLGNYTDTPLISGGAQAACSYLVRALATYPDLDLHVISCEQRGVPASIERVGNVTVYRLPSGSGRAQLLTRYQSVRRQIQQCLAEIKPDVIHAQDLGKYALSALGVSVPLIVTVHGIVREEARYYRRRRERWRALVRAWWIGRACAQSVQHIIAISPYVARYYPEFAGRHIYDIPNAIDEAFFSIDDFGDEGRILYAGRVIPRKRVCQLVEILDHVRRDVPNVTLRIAGDLSNSGYAAMVQEEITARGLADHIRLLGQLDEAAMLEEFRRARVVVLASGQETAPMVLAEAMAAGKPVVATAVGGVSDMVDDGRTGFVVPLGDGRTFAERLVTILREPDRAHAFAQAARRKATEEYRASSVAARTRDVYYHVAALHPGTPWMRDAEWTKGVEVER